MKRLAASVFVAALPVAAGAPIGAPARAAWPEHTVTVIVPFPPGGRPICPGWPIAAALAPLVGQNARAV
jgi:hypothetical protein